MINRHLPRKCTSVKYHIISAHITFTLQCHAVTRTYSITRIAHQRGPVPKTLCTPNSAYKFYLFEIFIMTLKTSEEHIKSKIKPMFQRPLKNFEQIFILN